MSTRDFDCRASLAGVARRALAVIVASLAAVGAGAPAALAESRITVLAPQSASGRGTVGV